MKIRLTLPSTQYYKYERQGERGEGERYRDRERERERVMEGGIVRDV